MIDRSNLRRDVASTGPMNLSPRFPGQKPEAVRGPVEPMADDPRTPAIEGAVLVGEIMSASYADNAATIRIKAKGSIRLTPGARIYVGAAPERADNADPRARAISRMNGPKIR